MVKTNSFLPCWQNPTLEFPNYNYMDALVEPSRNGSFPAGTNHGTCMFPANMFCPGSMESGMPVLGPGCANDERACNIQTLPHAHMSPREKHFAYSIGHDKRVMPNAISGLSPKRFLIFDQSGSQTRLILNSTCSPLQKPTGAFANHGHASRLHDEGAAIMGKMFPMKPMACEEPDENHIIGEESEMHEDTEELNALLYSDSDDDSRGGEDDEEISTGHSPIGTIRNHEKLDQVDIAIDEVGSSDGATKRLRLVGGDYKKCSVMDTSSFIKPSGFCDYSDDADSGYTKSWFEEEAMGSVVGEKRFRPRKDRIRDTLKILETIIPGGRKGKDPLLILDDAIDYLVSLRLKAKAQGALHL